MLGAVYAGDPSVIVTLHHKPDFLDPEKEKLLAPREGDTVVLSAADLARNATVAFSALTDALGPHVGISVEERSVNITTAKKACAVVDMTKSFFASYAWTGTHNCGDFGAKIASTYCLVRVQNAVITSSGRHVNYKEGKGQGGSDQVIRAAGAKSTGVVVDGKHGKYRKTSSDQTEEEYDEEEDALQTTGGKGGQGGSGDSHLKKGSSEEDDE